MFAQKLLPVLAVFGIAAAQTANSAICTATATIHSQADATNLADCSTFKGDIVIAPDASGTIALDGIQQITGSLSVVNAVSLTQLSADQIGSIGGTFTLTNLTLLSTLQFSSLTAVNIIDWTALPNLAELTFPETISKSSSVTVSNTFLNTLDGINLDTVATLQIDNNPHLLTFSTQVANITNSVVINANGENLEVSFPNLIWAGNMSFRDISSLSIPSLAVVNGSFGLYESFVDSVSAPNLTAVGSTASNTGSFAVVSNTQLANITVPLLKSVGGAVQVVNNTELAALAFPTLSFVGGAVDLTGNFTTPSLPDVTNVRGTFTVQSNQNIDCSSYSKIKGNIQGKFSCSAGGSSTSGTGTATGSSSTATGSKGAAASYGFSEAALGVSVVGGLLQMLL